MVINEIMRVFRDEMTKCKNYFSDRKVPSEKERDELNTKFDYLKMMTKSLKTDIATFSDHDVINMEEQMKKELKIALEFDTEKHIGYTECTPCDAMAISSQLEIAHTLSLEEVSSFKPDRSMIYFIKAVPSRKSAWIRETDDDKIRLFSENGQELQTLTYSGGAFEVRSDGNILLLQGNMITMLDEHDKLTELIQVTPLYLQYFSLTKEGDLLVSLKDDGKLYQLDASSRRIVRHMTTSGKVLHTYEFKDNSTSRLLTFPGRVLENKNTDICVINLLSQRKAELIVLTREGKMKFCFRGFQDEFYPVDLECDSKCRILVADADSRSLILLNSDGTHISVIHSFEDIISALSLKDDKLWCGFSEGSITVYKYK